MRVCSNFLIRLSPRCKNYASKSNEIKNRIKSKHPAMKFLKIYLSRSIIKTLYIYFAVRNISIIIFSFGSSFIRFSQIQIFDIHRKSKSMNSLLNSCSIVIDLPRHR